MIKAFVETVEGRVLLLGLSAVNIHRLQHGQPIHFTMAQLVAATREVDPNFQDTPLVGIIILAGETEESIARELQEIRNRVDKNTGGH